MHYTHHICLIVQYTPSIGKFKTKLLTILRSSQLESFERQKYTFIL